MTGKKTACYFHGEAIEEKVRAGWKHRVVVIGQLQTDKTTGDAEEMRVEDIRILGTRSELPQIDDLLGFDITGGMDSADYVRGLRDDD